MEINLRNAVTVHIRSTLRVDPPLPSWLLVLRSTIRSTRPSSTVLATAVIGTLAWPPSDTKVRPLLHEEPRQICASILCLRVTWVVLAWSVPQPAFPSIPLGAEKERKKKHFLSGTSVKRRSPGSGLSMFVRCYETANMPTMICALPKTYICTYEVLPIIRRKMQREKEKGKNKKQRYNTYI